jgi:hypothetical protein
MAYGTLRRSCIKFTESAFNSLLSLNTKGKGWDRLLLLVGNSVADPDTGSGDGFRDPVPF